jgi:hypothetical protein
MTFDECVLKYPIGTKLNLKTSQEKVVRYYMNDQDLKYWRNRAERYGNFTIETNCICSYIKTVEKFDLVEGYVITLNEEDFLEAVPARNTCYGWVPIEVTEDVK